MITVPLTSLHTYGAVDPRSSNRATHTCLVQQCQTLAVWNLNFIDIVGYDGCQCVEIVNLCHIVWIKRLTFIVECFVILHALVIKDIKPHIKCYDCLICNVNIQRYRKDEEGGGLPPNRSCKGPRMGMFKLWICVSHDICTLKNWNIRLLLTLDITFMLTEWRIYS